MTTICEKATDVKLTVFMADIDPMFQTLIKHSKYIGITNFV